MTQEQAWSAYSTRAVAQRCKQTIGGMILRRLCILHPEPVKREILMLAAGITVKSQGPVLAYASFHWNVERINDELSCFGWQVTGGLGTGETYRLERLP